MCKLCHSSLIPFGHRGGLALQSTQSEGKGRQSVAPGPPQRAHATLMTHTSLAFLRPPISPTAHLLSQLTPLFSLRRKARKHYIPECSEQTVLKEPHCQEVLENKRFLWRPHICSFLAEELASSFTWPGVCGGAQAASPWASPLPEGHPGPPAGTEEPVLHAWTPELDGAIPSAARHPPLISPTDGHGKPCVIWGLAPNCSTRRSAV